MSDGVYVTLVLPFKPEAVDGSLSTIKEQVQQTKLQKGFRSLRIDRHAEQPGTVILSEEWDSAQDYHNYLAWRSAQGENLASLAALLAAPPQMNFWDKPVVQLAKD